MSAKLKSRLVVDNGKLGLSDYMAYLCDGPGCSVEGLNSLVFRYKVFLGDMPYHFCSKKCLNEWAANLKEEE